MKTNPALDHVYVNDGFKCSSISITTNGTEQNGGSGGSQGSNEFICKYNNAKVLVSYLFEGVQCYQCFFLLMNVQWITAYLIQQSI